MLQDFRILVVEDVAAIRSLIVRLLERLGCDDIFEAADTATARTWLDTRGFDAVLLDYELVGETGLKLIRQLRADPKARNRDVPIIVLTGHTGADVILSTVQAGANSYMVKPVMPDRLGQRILDVIAGHEGGRPEDDDDAPPREPADIFWIGD